MKNFENNLKRLNEIIHDIEAGNALDAVLELYKEGMSIAADCATELSAFEEAVLELRVENGEWKNGNFTSKED